MLFELGAGQPKRLLIVINYPAIDGVSWRILLEDLQTAYLQASRGHAIQLPAKTTSYQQWAERLAAYARTSAVRDELGFWLGAVRPGEQLPIDTPGGDNSEASARVVARTLDVEETRALLQDAPRAYRTQINDVLLTALIQAFESLAGHTEPADQPGGPRPRGSFEDVNLSRTVGWFTSCFPVLLQLAPGAEPGEALVGTKEQLRRIPQHGIGYWLLRYLSANPAIVAQLRALPQPEVRFNYLGQFDQVVSGASLFRRARESYGPTRSPKGHRDHVLVIEGLIAEGQLHVELTYSANLHRRENIERLADGYVAALRGLIAHCLAPQAGRFTPSDFLLANLDERTFRILATQIERLDALEGPGMKSNNVEDVYPLSPMQQGILFHARTMPGTALYFVQWLCQLHGQLDIPAFQRAWQLIVDRHPQPARDLPLGGVRRATQVVRKRAPLPWELADWRDMPADQQQVRLQQCCWPTSSASST